MGIKLKFKKFISNKIKALLNEETPTIIVSNKLIKAGKQSFHNGNFEIRGAGTKVKIGSYCAIGKDVKLIVNNHDIKYASTQYSFYKSNFNDTPFIKTKSNYSIQIGSDVWVGDNVIILPNVTIGHGAVIGAGSVVSKNVSPYSVVAGVPAKEIKKRFSENIIDELIKSEWWTWSDEKIKENKDFFFEKLDK